MADVVALYGRAVEAFGARVRAVGDDQWHLPTPNAEWDVRALVNHVVNENLWVPPLLEGLTIDQVGNRFDGEQLGDDPAAAWQRAADAAVEASRGEGVALREVHVSFGDITGEDYLAQVATDHVVHAWDLAHAIGGDVDIEQELVDFAYGFLEPQAEAWRAAGAFGPRVRLPEGADRLSQLLALTGRDPGSGLGVEAPEAGQSPADMPADGTPGGTAGLTPTEASPAPGATGSHRAGTAGQGEPGAGEEVGESTGIDATGEGSAEDRLGSDLAMLSAQARTIAAELESYTTTRNHWWPTKPEDWTNDLKRYDRVLVTMAILLGLPVPPEPPHGAQRRLGPAERADLERRLMEHGIDLGKAQPA